MQMSNEFFARYSTPFLKHISCRGLEPPSDQRLVPYGCVNGHISRLMIDMKCVELNRGAEQSLSSF